MTRGKVRWFDDIHGYGFIDCDMGEAFFYYKDIRGGGPAGLPDGMEVDFELHSGPKGFYCRDIYPLNKKHWAQEIEPEKEEKVKNLNEQLQKIISAEAEKTARQ